MHHSYVISDKRSAYIAESAFSSQIVVARMLILSLPMSLSSERRLKLVVVTMISSLKLWILRSVSS